MMDDCILENFGGYQKNHLGFLIKSQFMDDDVEDNITLHTSPYYTRDTFVESLENHRRKFYH